MRVSRHITRNRAAASTLQRRRLFLLHGRLNEVYLEDVLPGWAKWPWGRSVSGEAPEGAGLVSKVLPLPWPSGLAKPSV